MTQAMTAQEAITFSSKSLASELILAQAASDRGCDCIAYHDWFTYRRWRAQGQQVQKGEHGIKLTTYVPIYRDEDGQQVQVGTRPRTTTVFCRCQVKPTEH